MRRAVLIAAFCLIASSTEAAWEFSDVSDEDGKAYKGWAVDVSGELEAQIFCDDWFPDAMDITIYTAEKYDAKDSYPESGVMKVRIDDRKSVEVTAFYDEHEGELLVYTSSLEAEGVDAVLLVMARANSSIGFSFEGRDWRFPAENVFDVIEKMANACPTESNTP